MKKIFKYPIPMEERFSIGVPFNNDFEPRPLSTIVQNGEPFVYIMVNHDPENKLAPTRKMNFRLAGTGHPIEEKTLPEIYQEHNLCIPEDILAEVITFVGRIDMNGYVFHLFEIEQLP